MLATETSEDFFFCSYQWSSATLFGRRPKNNQICIYLSGLEKLPSKDIV